ncbi:MAG: hypothetical protein CMH64_02905 [Nanoarchaeota archaeon]|jgi:glycosyltransferase involved in cell wall biosynthesis|nr:hypothetical protein [Nanoarchaeota archaeon]|tara:strand:+ start:173 stop:868 length:696 start_codon:yes stop_codon:yes gene_type:complete
MEKSITVMIPAYNEEKGLATTVNMVQKIIEDLFTDYEILIFDDFSSDRTGEIADDLVKENPKIRAIHNEKNRGLGYNFRRGAKIATKEYYCLIWADVDSTSDSIKYLLSHTGDADFITSYIGDKKRALHRRFVSEGFIYTLNLLFNMNMRGYCGITVYNTEQLRNVKMRTNSFAMNAEVMIPLVKRGFSYKEYPLSAEKEKIGESTIFRLKNIIGVLKTVSILFLEIYFKL